MSDTPSTSPVKSMDAIMALCKRRGFIYQASEIYGGINGFWDYGPLGAQMKKNLRDAWWQDMIMRPCWGKDGPNGKPVRCVPVETRIIQHPKVWEASGHVGGFNDPMVDDKETKQRFRADHLQGVFRDGRFGPESEPKKLAAQLMRQYDGASTVFPPYKTIIANSADEALQSILTDRKTQKSLGLNVLDGKMGSFNTALLIVQEGDMVLTVGVRAVSMNELTFQNEEIPSPYSQKKGSLTKPRQFNLMFFTYTGATATEDDKVYLRPETAQGVFVQFKNVVDTTRVKIPFGIGNTGTSFRNEITPRNFTFRSREFEQAELEFFCHPDESVAWYKFWRDFRMQWWQSIGLTSENLILREHEKDELSHYSSGTSDVEYRFPFTAPGYGELEGIAHRGCYDLTQHQQHSGVKMEYNDTERGEVLPNGGRRGERYIPHCIEPAAGLDRGVLALICEAYTRDESRPSPEFMKFHPRIAPIKAAIFPLVAKDGMPEVAEKLQTDLNARFWKLGGIELDEKQSIGKRYARMDEAGCPYCFTIDGDTMKDQTVTCRDRDTGAQTRISIDKVGDFLAEKLGV
ncbi:MAG: glycine--tRNA ligase [Phycisphaeraceae bacterium]|nr:MAG: glycine--tRNA ligase [Phycisphaeraceae bacterium]